jgi:hypothetical protein
VIKLTRWDHWYTGAPPRIHPQKDRMNTATDTPNDEALTPDEQYAARNAQAALMHAQKAPIDQALARPNVRPHTAIPPSLFDALEPLSMPSMALDPGQITSNSLHAELEGWNCEGAVEALTALQSVTRQIVEARETLRANPIKHEAELILELDDLHGKLWPTAAKKVDAVVKNLNATAAALEAQLNAQVKDSPHGSEIRQFVRSQKPGERMATLRQAIERGDATTVGALLGSPAPYLTGLDLSPEMHAALRNQWHTKLDPIKAKQLALMRHAQASLEKAGSVFLASTDAMLGVKHTTVAKLRQQREKVRTVIGAIAG